MKPLEDSGREQLRARETWPAGSIIKGEFIIEQKLRSGGFGVVYQARHRLTGSAHVIKRLHDAYASDPEYVRKFLNEGHAIRRLKGCPNIVEVDHMTQSEDGYLMLVMEHVAGGDLTSLMESRTLAIGEVVDFGQQIATGLGAAHEAGLIHRDIKPQNVLLSKDRDGKPVLKIIDFGLAADHARQDQQGGMVLGGSVGYAAPEQWTTAGEELDGRTDLYALGATMYRMLSGRMPYPEINPNDLDGWLDRARKGPPQPAGIARADCPPALSELIQQMLVEKPEGRPASARLVADRLGGLRRQDR